LLLGDAAHAIVPFHGQGINAGFEDCRELDQLITTHGADWASVTALFEARRLPDTQAIARMALENYVEMRDGVRDPAFERRKALAFELERRTGGRFTPRYSLVMFHPEVGYAEAERRGEIQDGILRRATTGPEDDIELALQLIDEQL
jgi:kynurenine 3-monooxygenase